MAIGKALEDCGEGGHHDGAIADVPSVDGKIHENDTDKAMAAQKPTVRIVLRRQRERGR